MNTALLSKARALLAPHSFRLHLAAWVCCALAAWWVWPPALTALVEKSPDPRPVTMPHQFKVGQPSYVVEGKLEVGLRGVPHLTVVADDCLQSVSVDGASVYTTKCSPCETCAYKRVKLPPLTRGAHDIQLVVVDYGVAAALDIRQGDGVTTLALLVWLLGGLLVFVLSARRGVPMAYAWLGGLALVLVTYYHLCTSSDLRQHDVGGHKEYITHLLAHGTLPRVQQGWETWQPPLYYWLAAQFSRATTWLLASADVHRRVQVMSSLMYVAVVWGGILSWRRLGFTGTRGWLGLALLVGLPAHVFLSGRVNNDAIGPLMGMVLTLLGWDYWQRGRKRTAAVLGVVLLACIMAKTSQVSLAAAVGLLVLLRDHLDARGLVQRAVRAALVGVPGLAWLAFWFHRNKEQTGEWMYVNANLQDSLKVTNNAFKYLWFDIPSFLSEASFTTFGGKMRDSYATALAASSLTGEWGHEWVGTLQTFLRAAYLPVLVLLALGLILRPRPWQKRPWAVAVLLVGVHAVFMISYNWRYSYACNEDARLWSPVYFPLAVLWGWGQEEALERTRGRLRSAVVAAPVVFLLVLAGFWWRFLLP
ncbi:MAG: hypothetical protein HY904_19040 [Deltaproteobacteria bacterium]|nr:hypothetical protein [Deltaproteobacteria bacterium]